ncbi:MAG: hypothetical protein KAH04_04740 [Psychrilyobacter sp.]|nr:hypothetical protein [Psychrilyobacter sp.]
MNIFLRNVQLYNEGEKLYEKDNLNFSKLVEESFYEWTKLDEDEEKKIDWKGQIYIETDDEEFEYKIDTKGKYITSLDLDGFLNGEKIILEDNLELLLSTNHSYIYELLTYHIVLKLKLISEEKLKVIETNLFPKWNGGYLADDLEDNKTICDFISLFEPLLNEFEIIKKVKINLKTTRYSSKDGEIAKELKNYIEKYLEEEVFFIAYDIDSTSLFSKLEFDRLLTAGEKFNPDLGILEIE